jgi:hypothetical protein
MYTVQLAVVKQRPAKLSRTYLLPFETQQRNCSVMILEHHDNDRMITIIAQIIATAQWSQVARYLLFGRPGVGA